MNKVSMHPFSLDPVFSTPFHAQYNDKEPLFVSVIAPIGKEMRPHEAGMKRESHESVDTLGAFFMLLPPPYLLSPFPPIWGLKGVGALKSSYCVSV